MRTVRAVYLLLGAILAAFVAMLSAIVTLTPGAAHFGHEPQALIRPVVALVGLTALVWGLMVVWRNLAVGLGSSVQIYARPVIAI